nr:hypothetical protein [Tanacetum cinerariifolium]
MSRDVLTVGSTMRIPLLYRGEYSQWVERFMNYLEEQKDGEAMINSIKNGDQPLTRVTQVSIFGTTSTKQPPLKDKSMWSDQEKRIQKIDRLARSLLIQGLPEQLKATTTDTTTTTTTLPPPQAPQQSTIEAMMVKRIGEHSCKRSGHGCGRLGYASATTQPLQRLTAQAEDQTGSDAGAQAEGQAGSNSDETSEGQAGSNPNETSEG